MYEVIHEFLDLEDDNFYYHTGDRYPRDGKETTLERATELMSKKNKIGKPLIRDIPIMEEPVEEKKPATKKGRK